MSAMLLPGAYLWGKAFGDFLKCEWRNRRPAVDPPTERRSRQPLEPSTADAPDP